MLLWTAVAEPPLFIVAAAVSLPPVPPPPDPPDLGTFSLLGHCPPDYRAAGILVATAIPAWSAAHPTCYWW